MLRGVPAGDHKLTAQRVGYTPQTRSLAVTDGGTATSDFELVRMPTSLSAVVTTVTGQQERYKVGNAIASVGIDTVMRTAPVVTITDLLNGRAAGLQIYGNGGLSGTSSNVRIRGPNSMTLSNDPIFIVDGVRIESSTATQLATLGSGALTAVGFNGARPGRMADITPYEIESIDVVKGPSATTLYGSDAANGVIVIKTKRGLPGAAQWRFWTEQGTIEAADHFKPAYFAYGTNLATGVQQRCVLTQVASGVCRQDSVVTWNPLEDPVTSPIATGYRHVYGGQVRGGVERFTYFLSGDLSDETGYLRMPDAEQERIKLLRGVASLPAEQVRPNFVNLVNLRGNFGSALGERTHVNLSNGLISNRSALPGLQIFTAGGFGGQGGPTTNAGWFGQRPGELFALKNLDATTRFTTSVAGDYQPFAWLTTRATGGFDWSSTIFEALQRNGEGPATTVSGQRQDNRFNVSVWSVDLGGTATRSLSSQLQSKTTVGAQYNRRFEYNAFATGTNLAPGATTLAGAATTTSNESTIETIVAGVFLDESIEFRNRLFLTGAVRFDGGSAFGAEFSTVAYPKASISWVATDGTRSGWPHWIDNLRARAAIGSSGVQPSAVAALQRDALSSALFNGVAVTAANLNQLGNQSLKPETQTEIETGIDAELFRSRVTLELNVYQRRSRDAIANITLPPSVGSFLRPVNLGSVRNRGIEWVLNARLLDRPLASLDVGVNADLNENRLMSLGVGVPVTPTSQHQVGYPIYSLFTYGYTFDDLDHNNIITANEVTVDAAPHWYGTYRPQHTGSGTVKLGLFRDRLRLSGLADYRGKFDIADNISLNNIIFGTTRGQNDPTAPLDRQAAAQAVLKTTNAQGGIQYDGTFVRLREVSASYSLPPSVAKWIHVRGGDLSLSGRNLTIWTKFPGFSTEAPQGYSSGDGLNAGNPGAPTARYLLLRLTLTN
jgi:TonB-dependent SusC/RagA subfamily outer membrane receptor